MSKVVDHTCKHAFRLADGTVAECEGMSESHPFPHQADLGDFTVEWDDDCPFDLVREPLSSTGGAT